MPEILCELACEEGIRFPILSLSFVAMSIPRGPSTVICLDFMVTLTVDVLAGPCLLHRPISRIAFKVGVCFRFGDVSFRASAMGRICDVI